jgi:hypothetical protein
LFHLLLWAALGLNASADQGKEKSAFDQELEKYADYKTAERWVDYNGGHYREVEYGGKKYYIRFTQAKDDTGELDCGMSSANMNSLHPNLIEGAIEVYHRSKLFVSFLTETCEPDANGRNRRMYRLDPRLGFTIPDDKKSVITNKKVFINPLAPTGLGFSGDW